MLVSSMASVTGPAHFITAAQKTIHHPPSNNNQQLAG